MKLQQALASLNQIEKSKFINCLDRLCSSAAKGNKAIATTLDSINRQIKDASGSEVTQLFHAVHNEFKQQLAAEVALSDASLSLMVNILSRDGIGVARLSWIEQLYANEWQVLDALAKQIKIKIEQPDLEGFNHEHRLKIFYDCVFEAYINDMRSNRDSNISNDERGVLNMLAKHLKISADEVAAIEHLINPIKADRDTIETCIQKLREMGVIFINRKTQEVIVVDEIVTILNEIQGKVLSDKYFVRILRVLSDAELSNILKAYGKPIRGVSRTEKIETCLHSRLNVFDVLSNDIFPDKTNQNTKKDRLKALMSDLDIQVDKIGSTLDERINVILDALRNGSEREFNMLSATSFKEMFDTLSLKFSGLSPVGKEEDLVARLCREYELEKAEEITIERLRLLSITPADVLYALSNEEVKSLRESLGVTRRGNPRLEIIKLFEKANDKLIENYERLANRDLNGIRSAGVEITESEIGLKFEEATKAILEDLGLKVDEDLRKEINTAKEKTDIILSLGGDDIIIGEAKTSKRGDFARYAATSRQVKAYASRCENFGKRVAQVLIIAPRFSDDFIMSAEMDPEINISLLTADGLKMIYEAFRAKKNAKFSPKLLIKGGLLKAELIANSL